MAKYPKLRQLGRPVAPPASPDQAVLETVPNPEPRLAYVVRFTQPGSQDWRRVIVRKWALGMYFAR